MTLYNRTFGLAQGIQRTMDHALLTLTTPGPFLHQLMDGSDKVLITFWEGDPAIGDHKEFNPERGDGRVLLLRPGMPGYAIPPSHDPDDAAADIRAGVPLWLLKSPDEFQSEPYVLGVGKLHPRWNSISLRLYCTASKQPLIDMYFGDPRIDMANPPEGHPSFKVQEEQIESAGGACEPMPYRAPQHPGLWSTAAAMHPECQTHEDGESD
jgi:hypothetical protein